VCISERQRQPPQETVKIKPPPSFGEKAGNEETGLAQKMSKSTNHRKLLPSKSSSADSKRKNRIKITIVIATLGDPVLAETISFLKKSTVQPEQILLCVPFQDRKKVMALAGETIKVVGTRRRGQVAQRATGFRMARTSLVLQMDDDVALHPRCLERMAETLLAKSRQTAIGPVLRWVGTNRACHRNPDGGEGWFRRLIQNSGRPLIPGRITMAGTNPGAAPSSKDGKVMETEWLPGGCVLHRRENLIFSDYYPFPGKAFYEDVIHSIHLRNKGIRLLVEPRAWAWIHPDPDPDPGQTFSRCRDIFRQSTVRKYVLRLLGRSLLPEIIYTFFALAASLFRPRRSM